MSAEQEAWLESNLPQSLFVYKGLHDVDGALVEWTPWAAFEARGLRIISPDTL
jgi:hypothetical protein